MTEQDINVHLDRCLKNKRCDDAAIIDTVDEAVEIGNSASKRRRVSSPAANTTQSTNNNASRGNNIFAHMMQRSAQLSKGDKCEVIRHRFHLHNKADGGFTTTWSSSEEDDVNSNDGNNNTAAKGEECVTLHDAKSPLSTIAWTATTTITTKKMKVVNTVDYNDPCDQQTLIEDGDNKLLELTISSSLPPREGDKKQHRLVQRHSRLSVSQLKSCLQKSIRRRAPLPAVRVAMELADRAWGELVRRLPIIVLEDSTLHPDFGLIVWLMVADSKVRFLFRFERSALFLKLYLFQCCRA